MTSLGENKNPPPQFIVLASSVKTKKVEVMSFTEYFPGTAITLEWGLLPVGKYEQRAVYKRYHVVSNDYRNQAY